eukprot:303662-Chlamydomonas_euryale.AAC.3
MSSGWGCSFTAASATACRSVRIRSASDSARRRASSASRTLARRGGRTCGDADGGGTQDGRARRQRPDFVWRCKVWACEYTQVVD